jgi:ABC-type transporter MlaC component
VYGLIIFDSPAGGDLMAAFLNKRHLVVSFLVVAAFVSQWCESSASAVARESANPKTISAREAVQQLVTLISTWSGSTDTPSFYADAAKRIDYDGMAQAALKPTQWRKMSETERSEYITSFRRLVETRYYLRWHKLFQRSHLAICGEEQIGSDSYLKTQMIRANAANESIVWRLHTVNNYPMVVSLNVDGKDLLARLSGRLQRGFDQQGSRALTIWLQRRATELSSQPESAMAPSRID